MINVGIFSYLLVVTKFFLFCTLLRLSLLNHWRLTIVIAAEIGLHAAAHAKLLISVRNLCILPVQLALFLYTLAIKPIHG